MAGRARKSPSQKNSSLSSKTSPPLPWQQQAQSLGWSQTDLNAIESLLQTGKDIAEVYRVERGAITIATYPADERLTRHLWKWHRVDAPEPAFAKPVDPHEEEHWCPQHGRTCDPTEEGCGHERVLFFDLCDCPPRGHFYECESYLWQQEAKRAKEQAKTVDITVDLNPPPPRKRKEEKVAKVQLRLDLG